MLCNKKKPTHTHTHPHTPHTTHHTHTTLPFPLILHPDSFHHSPNSQFSQLPLHNIKLHFYLPFSISDRNFHSGETNLCTVLVPYYFTGAVHSSSSILLYRRCTQFYFHITAQALYTFPLPYYSTGALSMSEYLI